MERLLYVERLRNHLGRKEAADDRKAHTLAERRFDGRKAIKPWPKAAADDRKALTLAERR